ncbi:MAG: hypothetical protein ACKVQU_00025 [Burkholderiales bacterium]
MKMNLIAAAVAATVSIAPLTVFAQDATRYSDRDRAKTWSVDKDRLQKSLGTGHDKAHYRQALEKQGFSITAVNYDRADYLEYEIVKGKETYEVQVDFKDGRSSKVDVTTSAWRADSTSRAMSQSDYKYQYPNATTTNPSMYSDRDRSKAFASTKGGVEKSLGVGQDRAHYKQALEKMGYQVTAVNYDRPDYMEFEVVKDRDSYEVQISFDKMSGKSTKVDVTTNVWQAEATEKALGQK